MTDKSHTGDRASLAGQRVHTMPGQRVVNLLVRGLMGTPGLGPIMGGRLVTLYIVGRKSGRRHSVPVAYIADGNDLLIGTSFEWGRNLRTGEPVAIRLKGKRRWADVQVSTTEPEVVWAYGCAWHGSTPRLRSSATFTSVRTASQIATTFISHGLAVHGRSG